jgi:hypothetical protein
MAPGQFGWSGLYGTDWVPDSVNEDFRTLACQSLDD